MLFRVSCVDVAFDCTLKLSQYSQNDGELLRVCSQRESDNKLCP